MTVRIRTWGGLGDVLLMTPALRAIKRTHPAARLVVHCISRSHFDLLDRNPYIDRLKLRDGAMTTLCVCVIHTAYHVLRSQGPLAWHWRLLMKATRAEFAVYSQCLPMLSRTHAADIIGQVLNVTIDSPQLDVFLSEDEEAHARAMMRQYPVPVAIHTTSTSSANKNWPLEKWTALVEMNPQYQFMQLGLAEEPAVPGTIDLRGKTSIRQAIALVKLARAFVGVESFLSHASNATGTPGVVLFGPSAPEVWGHANHTNVTRQLRCAPCIETLRNYPCPYGHPCLNSITVDEVATALRAAIGSN
jgi:ADP-heptose:LPS heptosyltransferase